MKKYVFVLLLACFPSLIWSQLTVSEINATTAANVLSGDGVTILSSTFSGGSNQLGQFWYGSDIIGISGGVILATGDVAIASTGNGGNQESQAANGTGFSAPLYSEHAGLTFEDTAELSMVFESTTSMVQFDIVFASDEYLEYVGSDFMDVMGIYIDGPGMDDSYAGFENVSMVPGTTNFISVDTVNTTTNSSYYVNNPVGNVFEPSPYDITYDGFTKKMTIVAENLQCGETYRINFAISDVSDDNFDSALFIGAHSIKSDFVVGQVALSPPSPYCVGESITANITYNPDWNYTWSTGESGFGISSITTDAVIGLDQISVTIENEAGCQITRTATVAVHANENVPPYVTSGVFNYYTDPNEALCFSIISADTPSEQVTITYSGVPGGASLNINDIYQDTALFCWTPTEADYGEHTFTITVTDNNSCGILSKTYTYKIGVLCPLCPECVYYEDRTPDLNPLPEFTEAVKCIEAGMTEDVIVGDDPVTFQAGSYIELGPNFEAGGSFIAEITEATCLDDCANCCVNWTGFTYDTPVPNVFTPNGDAINDRWFLNDSANSYCAFNALGFELWVVNRWGNTVYHTIDDPDYCCPYQAVNGETGLAYTAINWDGKTDGGTPVSDGTYFIKVKLVGCDADEYIYATVELITGTRAATPPYTTDGDTTTTFDSILSVFPNPASSHVTLFIEDFEGTGTVELFTVQGQLAKSFKISENKTILDLNGIREGIYLVKVTNNERIYSTKLIKE